MMIKRNYTQYLMVALGIILFVAVILPVSMSVIGTTAGTTAVTNQSFSVIYNGGSNTSATRTAGTCLGDFTWNNVYGMNNSAGATPASVLWASGTNYNAYPNGTVAWITGASGGVNSSNASFSCYNNNMNGTTGTLLNLIPLLLAVAALTYVAFGILKK